MADIVTEALARWVPDDHPGRRGQIGQDVKDLCAEITRLNEENERLRAALNSIKNQGELASVNVERPFGYTGGKKPATKEVWQFPRHLMADIDAALGKEDKHE